MLTTVYVGLVMKGRHLTPKGKSFDSNPSHCYDQKSDTAFYADVGYNQNYNTAFCGSLYASKICYRMLRLIFG